MSIFVDNIEKLTLENQNYRKVINTSAFSQLVLMSIKSGEGINKEIHDINDQFIRIERGSAKIIINNQEYIAQDDFAIVVPAGDEHEVINTGDTELKLYSIYSPPHHPQGTIHATKAEADEYEKKKNIS